MSCTTINVPSKTYNSMFGDISKCLWFEVTDNPGYIDVDYSVEPEQLYELNLSIFSYGDSELQWNRIFPRSSNPAKITGTTYIFNDPIKSLNIYKIVNV